MKYFVFIALLVGLSLPAQAGEHALKGVALVIGQSEYEHLAALPNPGNDARAIESLLEDLGFEVDGASDRDAKKLRRDLERFVEDAEGADAAIVYYSGHGIEAGGENFLVPVDADFGALDDIDRNLVPMSAILDELRARVPLTIFLIDACRSNPFPSGAVARKQGAPVAMSGSGLGRPRGFAAVAETATDTVGTIIGFAAEPGFPALDGEAGANSPYAAALMRHLSAMTGAEFGLVMRMVTEEVYLKTGTRQRPWVNESLRKQLFFGSPEKLPEGAQGAITGERRKLLLTIAGLPGAQRTQVESIARSDAVPLDTLYGMLAALGETEIPKDPASLQVALKAQAGRLKTILDERKALSVDDPDLKRLVAAADQAIGEGAIKTARSLLDEAKAAIEKSRGTIENVEAQARARRLANAEVLFKSAETAELDFDFTAAAADYASAFGWVENADRELAAKYKQREADALQSIFSYRGDAKAMAQAIAAYELALSLLDKQAHGPQWAKTVNNLANSYSVYAERVFETAPGEKAVALYRQSLAVAGRSNEENATTYSNLGIALHTLAVRKNDTALYQDAENAFAEALKLRDREKDKAGWALDMLNSANLDIGIADRNGEKQRYARAELMIEQALGVLDPVADRLRWAQGKNNLGIVQRVLGANAGDIGKVRTALKTYEEILPVFDRKNFPLDWASTNGNLAIAHTNIGAMQADTAAFETALGYYEKAFAELTREKSPVFWAQLKNTHGMALQVLGVLNSDVARLEQAAQSFRDALSVRARNVNAGQWAESQMHLASTLSAIASQTGDHGLSDEAIAAYRAAREVFTRETHPGDWRGVSAGLAMALQGKGILRQDDRIMYEAEAIYRDVLAVTDRAAEPLEWASAMKDIATIQFMLGTTHGNKAEVEESIRSFDFALEEYQKSGSFMDKMMIGAMRNNAAKALDLFE